MSLDLKTLGQTIKKYRLNKSYSTQQLSDILNVSAGFINHLENGKNDAFKLDLLLRLIKELDIPLNEISPFNSSFIEPDFIPNIETLKNNSEYNLISNTLSLIINSYLKCIKEFNYKPELIQAVSSHLVSELNYTKNIKDLA